MFDSLGEGVSAGLLLLLWSVFVKLHEFGKIELRLLEDLYFPYHAVVVEWENFAALLLNLLANILFNPRY